MSDARAFCEARLVGAVLHGAELLKAATDAGATEKLFAIDTYRFTFLAAQKAAAEASPVDPLIVCLKLSFVALPAGGNALDLVGGEAFVKKIHREAKELASVDKVRELVEAVKMAPPPEPPAASRGPASGQILCSDRDLPDITEEVLAALIARNGNKPRLFVRARQLVRLGVEIMSIDGEVFRRPVIDFLNEPALRGEMARSASYVIFRGDDLKLVSPPMDVVRDVGNLDDWPFPALAGIVEQPIIRPDGSILDKPGYDEATGLYYRPARGLKVPPVPERPTDEDVRRALDLLDEAIQDFPWADDAAKANTFGLMLTPIIRHAIGDAQVPGSAIDAPTQGTGKGLLNDLIALVATGRRGSLMSPCETEDEWRKRITSVLLRGATYITIDNVIAPLDSAALAVALTAETWEDRILGVSRMVSIPIRVTWVATGNNIRLRGDLVRRWYRIRLDSKLADPTKRSGFRHPNLLEWARDNRGDLLAALLTMTRAWYSAGCPKATVPIFASFERWAQTVGGILAYAGVEGFLTNLDAFRHESDEEREQWTAFLLAWRKRYEATPITTSSLVAKLQADQEFRDLLPESLSGRWGEKGFPSSLGQHLGARKEVRFGEPPLWLKKGQDSHTKNAAWSVCAPEDEPPESKDEPLAPEESSRARAKTDPPKPPQPPHDGQLELEKVKETAVVGEEPPQPNGPDRIQKDPIAVVAVVSPSRSPDGNREIFGDDGYDSEALDALASADEIPVWDEEDL